MPPFELVPFVVDPLVSGLTIAGNIERMPSRLRASYTLSGALSNLIIPTLTTEKSRRDGLWKTTCFELFAAPSGLPNYFEINLSPSGDWQAYSFTGYRESGALLAVSRFTSYRKPPAPGTLELGFELGLEQLESFASALEISVTAVLEHASGAKSYWALTHKGDRPDFHKRDSFILKA